MERVIFGFAGAVLAAGTPAAVSEEKPTLRTVDIPIDGMACVVCAATVKKPVKSLDGVSKVEVSLEKRSARVTYATGRLSAERIVAAIDGLGYKAGTPREVE
jgi:copper chaperone CopZ